MDGNVALSVGQYHHFGRDLNSDWLTKTDFGDPLTSSLAPKAERLNNNSNKSFFNMKGWLVPVFKINKKWFCSLEVRFGHI